jgi:hypothetical protein
MCTATVFISRRRYRVAVNSNDHPPPHVHVFGKGCEARFRLNCPERPVEYWGHDGSWNLAQLNELGAEIAERLGACCKVWSDIHG